MRNLFLSLACVILLTPAAGAQQDRSTTFGPVGTLVITELEKLIGYQIGIRRIDGSLLSKAIIRDVTLRDRQGVFLRIGEVRIDWNARRLLSGELNIEYLQLVDVNVLRNPVPPDRKTAPPPPPPPDGKPVPPVIDRLLIKGDLDPPLSFNIAELRVDRVRLAKDVVGAPSAFSIRGKVVVTDEGQRLDVDLRLNRLSGAAPEGRIRVRLPKDGNRLTVNVRLDDEPGGLLGRLLGLNPRQAIRVRLNGDAPTTAWRGRLTANAGDTASIAADISTEQLQTGRRILVDGTATSALFTRRFPGLAKTVKLRFDAVYGDTAVDFRDVALTTESATLKIAGRVPFDGAGLDLRLDLTAQDLSKFGQVTPIPFAGDGRVQMRLTGRLRAPDVALDAQVARIAMERFTARQVALRLRFNPATPGPGEKLIAAKGRLVMALTATDAAVALPDGRRRPLKELKLDIAGDLDWPAKRIKLDQLVARVDSATLRASGDVASLSPLKAEGQIDFRGDIAGDLFPGVSLAGAQFKGAVAIDMAARTGSADITFAANRVQTGTAAVDRLLAGVVNGRVDARWTGDKVTVAALRLRSGGLNLDAAGVLGADRGDRFTFTARIDDIAPLASRARVALAGAVTARGEVRGAGGAVNATVTADGTSIVLRGVRLGQVSARISATNLSDRTGRANIRIVTASGQWDSNIRLGVTRLSATRFRIDRLTARVPGARVTGRGTFESAGGGFTGTVRVRAPSLAAATRPFGIPAAGAVWLTGTFRAAGGRQGASLYVNGRSLRYGYGAGASRAARIRARLSIWDLGQLAGLTGSVTASNVTVGGTTLNSVRVTARAGRGGTRFTASATTLYRARRAQVTAAGVMRRGGRYTRLRLDTLTARYRRERIVLAAPATLRFGPGLLSVRDARLRLGKGEVAVTYIRRGGRVRGDVKIDKLPARILLLTGLARPAHGEFNGMVRFSGTAWRPVTDFDIRGTGIRQAFAPASAALNVAARGQLAPGGLQVDGHLGAGASKQQLSYRLRSRPGRAGGVEARITGRIDMAPLSNSGLFWAHRISGTLAADLTIVSGAGLPRANGHITLSNGRFLHAQSGAVFRNLNLRAEGSGQTVRLVRAEGDDGSGGRLSATGQVLVNPDRGYPFELRVRANRARVVRREDMLMVVSGDLRVTRQARQPIFISGKVTVNQAELSIPEGGGTTFTRLNVVEINKPEWMRRLERRRPPAPPGLPVRLELDVDVPGRFWVRGRGLEVELRGALRLRGTTAKPQLRGRLSTVRGHLDLLGKRFQIERGRIEFANPELSNPNIDFEARAARTGVTATIKITGTAKKPRFSIESEEGLPRDQVLSQLLFGKDVTQLSTSESLSLAAGAATLFGPGGGVGVLDRIRRATGLDVVDVTGGADGPRAVVGKYVTDRVLVKAEQGVGANDSAVGVEVEVTKNIRVEAKTATDGTSRVGIRWQHDY